MKRRLLEGDQVDQNTKRRIEQVRRRWWVVVAVTVIAVLASATFLLLARPTYVGKSSLMLSARTPDEDAVMVVGYLTIFNDPATTDWLRSTAKIPEDVTFEARTVAASPILTVEATADDPRAAQDAAVAVSEAFANYVNSAQRSGKDKFVAELMRQLNGVNPFAADGSTNQYYAALQARIDDARGNSTNELVGLQPRAGVTKNSPNAVFKLATGAVGGLLLGIIAALGLGALSTRLANSADLRDKTGIEPLAEIPAAGDARRNKLRQNRFRELVNVVSLEDLPKPAVIALTNSREGRGARHVAEPLAELSARRGSRTVLVYADNDVSQPGDGTGFNDALTDRGLVPDLLKEGHVASLRILPAGSILADRYPVMTHDRILAVLDELRAGADTIIIAAPSVADSSETPLLCAAADATMLVVPTGSRVREVTTASEALTKAHLRLLGAVLIDEPKPRDQRGASEASSNAWTEFDEAAFADPPQRAVGHRATEPIR